jgi:hypothetical protein
MQYIIISLLLTDLFLQSDQNSFFQFGVKPVNCISMSLYIFSLLCVLFKFVLDQMSHLLPIPS